MILSIHIPKTAGTSFGDGLRKFYGSRLLHRFDIDHWPGFATPETIAIHHQKMIEFKSCLQQTMSTYDVIHGHFVADQYAALFPDAKLVSFFRDPYQQTISHYEFLSSIPETHDHRAVKLFHEERMSLIDFIRWEAFSNEQSYLLGKVPLQQLTVIGLTEEFGKSLDLFNHVFDTRINNEFWHRRNPDKSNDSYDIKAEIRKEISQHRAADIELYERAKEAFRRQAFPNT